MDYVIQYLAGKVYAVLEEHPCISAQELKAESKLSDKELFLAIGWLIHDNKLAYNIDNDRISIESDAEKLDFSHFQTYSMT